MKKIRSSNKKIKRISFLFIFVLIICGIISYFNYVVNPIILQTSQSKVQSMAQKAVSSAIYEVINNSALYDSLITITRDDAGEIQLISSNALQINLLTRELSKNAQSKLELIGETGIKIPIGSFTGMPIFAGRGPSVTVKLLPIGTISSNFISEFTQQGINQTNHRIYVNVVSQVSVILPTYSQKVSTTTQMLICESIIIGKVPETYLKSSSLDEVLNLVPN